MTREEAINEIKSWAIPSEKGREVLETLIPELHESEDERIRKELINFLRSPFINENITDEKVAPWIAWLEKQKEPVPIPDKFSGLKSLMLQYLQSAANRKDDSEIESDTDLWGRKILDYVWKYSDEQKEQKPEWSEEDEDVLQNIIQEIEWERRNTTVDKDIRNYDRQLNFLKSLRPSWKPSEKQMEALKAVIDSPTNYQYIENKLKTLYDELKKL